MSQAQNLANLSQDYGVIPMSNRNLFVDGAFDFYTGAINVAQALSNSTVGYAGPTMWAMMCGVGGAGTITTFDLRTSSGLNYGVLEAPQGNCLIWTQSTASTGTVAGQNAPVIVQRLEGVKTGAGKSLTLSFKMWVNAGQQITIPSTRCSQNFGGGGTPSANVTFDKAVNWVVTPTPTKFSVRLDVPSIQGKTIGTNGNDLLSIGLWLPPGVTFTLAIAEASLRYCNPLSSSDINGNGGEPTAFEYLGLQAELARVQRHYWTTYAMGTIIGTASAGSYLLSRVPSFGAGSDSYPLLANPVFPVQMRTYPAMAVYSNQSGAVGKIYANGADVPGFFGITSLYGFALQVNNTPVAAGGQLTAHVVADARL